MTEPFDSLEPSESPVPSRRTAPRRRPRPRAPRRSGPPVGPTVWRLPVLVFLAALLAVVGIAAGSASTSPSPTPPLVVARAAPLDAVSSAWYCTGGSGDSGFGPASIALSNVGSSAANGTVTVVNDLGKRVVSPVSVPARGQVVVVPSSIEQGTWLGAEVALDAGGVTATEFVHGRVGWSEAPCATATSSQWAFAAGSTAGGDLLFVSVFNPTTTTAVVDMAFATPAGEAQPAPFQGLVLAPDSLVVAQVAAFVQNQPSISTLVQTRSGQVVATELQQHVTSAGVGLSLRLGAPAPEPVWHLPQSVDVATGDTSLVVFNPSAGPESVRVSVRLASGPVSPFTAQVPAFSTWTLDTSQQARIPPNTDFSTTVVASGGPGVTVDRVMTAPSSTPGQKWGTVSAVPDSSAGVDPARWLLPSPALSGPNGPAVAGGGYFEVALANTTGQEETVRVEALTPTGPSAIAGLADLHLGPHAFVIATQPALQVAGTDPLLVQSSGPLATVQEATPPNSAGVVAMGGIPLG